MTKKSSFLRQLNLYSFNRFSAGSDQGSYYHEKFLKGMKYLARRMVRQKVNGNRIRSAGNPDDEPTLSLYPVCPPPIMPSSLSSPTGSVGGEGGQQRHQEDEHAVYSALATMAAAGAQSSSPSSKKNKFNGSNGSIDNMSGNVSSDDNNDEGQEEDDDDDDNDAEDYASSDDNNNQYVTTATKTAHRHSTIYVARSWACS